MLATVVAIAERGDRGNARAKRLGRDRQDIAQCA
jgi:hypothetical protein